MIRRHFLPLLAALVAAACVVYPLHALAHLGGEQFFSGPDAPSPGAPQVTLLGLVTELRLEDRVVGLSIRYVGLRTDDGQRVRLKGPGIASLASGSRVEASGRLDGATLFASDVRVTDVSLAGAAPRAKVEQSIEGRYTLVIGDDFDAGRASYEHTVIDDAGRMTPVAFAVMPDVLHNGMRVVVSGARAADGETIEADRVTILALAPSRNVAQSEAGIAATAQAIAILVKFTDTATEPFTPASVQALMYGGPGTNSVAEFYKEASYGLQLVNGVVTPWLQLSIATPTTCSYSSIGTAADTAASAAGYNLASYTHRVYFFPRVSSCGWSGLATVGGGRAWINQSASLLVVAHELGHNFGALHAASLDCGNAVIGGTCTSSAYGDSFNVMGNQRAMHFAAFQKFDFAWITASNVATHASGVATYTLSPFESAGGTTYAVKIPARTNRTYWLEFRRPLGFDAGLSSFPNNGVQMRVASPFESICGGCSDDTELLDATPLTSALTDGTLLAGKAYADWDTGYTVSVLAASSTSAQVQVASGAPRKRRDFDLDLKTELLWRNATSGATSLWLMNGTSQSGSTQLMTDPNWRVTHFGDFDGDRRADLVWRNDTTGVTAIWLMNGAQFASGATVMSTAAWRVTHVADFNGDGKDDLIWRNDSTGTTALWLMNGLAYASGATLLADPSWQVAIASDFDGDRKVDLLWRNATTQAAAIWLMNGTQMKSGAIVLTTPGWVPTHTFDFDNDGRGDLVWRNPATGATAMWLMNGTQRAAGAALLADPAWSVTHVGDFGDARPGLVWRNATSGVTALWLVSGTTTVSSTTINADGNWSVVDIVDANGDNRHDLVWRHAVTGESAVWLMNGAAMLSGATVMTSPDWANVALE
jgi:hypothetical protein